MPIQTHAGDCNRIEEVSKLFARVSTRFAEFHSGAKTDFANFPDTALSIGPLSDDGRSFCVNLKVRTIHFELIHLLDGNGGCFGRVYCRMEDPLKPQERVRLDEFLIRTSGMSDAVDADPNGDGELYASQAAYRIIGYFALKAFQQGSMQV